MTEYITRRLLLALPTFVLVLFATFMAIRLAPGSLIDVMLAESPYATPEDRARLEEQLGLDKPIPTQFVTYVGEVMRGDLGESPYTHTPVIEEIRHRLPVSFEFGVYAILISLVIALPVGILSASARTRGPTISPGLQPSSLSRCHTSSRRRCSSCFPASGGVGRRRSSTNPGATGRSATSGSSSGPRSSWGSTSRASVMRLTRTQMLEVLRQDYIRTAWAKGLRERAVISGHALKNALIPVVTVIGLQIPIAVGGSLILETIFNMPGVGRYFISAVSQRDYPSLQGVTLVIAFIVIISNLVVDVTYGVLDPRIRYS